MDRLHDLQKDMVQGEIVIYEPDELTHMEVWLQDESIWLTQAQLSILFQKDQSVIARHIKNVFQEGELEERSNMQILHNTFSKYKPVKVYSLDVTISVGYRVKSIRGTQFRQWANSVLKDHLLKGYSINSRISQLQGTLLEHERILDEHSKKIDFFVKTSMPPVEGIFFDGQIFDAYVFVSDLIKSAKKSIVLIDNYIDESVLTMLDKRQAGVAAVIYTAKIDASLKLDIDRHNSQYRPITVRTFRKSHDRFLMIDEAVYHIGASLKDLGRKWFAFSLMHDFSASDILKQKMRHTKN